MIAETMLHNTKRQIDFLRFYLIVCNKCYSESKNTKYYFVWYVATAS